MENCRKMLYRPATGPRSSKVKMKSKGARGTLNRDSVMDTALEIADRDGLDAVTIRAIARQLGVTPMALYTYFSDKNALYEGMRERAVVRANIMSPAGRSWQSKLEEVSRGIFRIMREHPYWIPLFTRDNGPPHSILGIVDELLTLMVQDGFLIEEALCAYGCAVTLAVGSVLFEEVMTIRGDIIVKRLTVLKEIVTHQPGRYDSLTSVVARVDRWRFDEIFEFGLKSLIAGLQTPNAQPLER